jgi:hypothetical protein
MENQKDKDSLPARNLTRRDLSFRAALLAIAGASAPAAGLAQQQSREPGLLAVEISEVDSKYAAVLRKYGERLNEAERTRVHDILVRHERMLHRIREFSLENSDSPAIGLRLYPTDTAPAAGKKKE